MKIVLARIGRSNQARNISSRIAGYRIQGLLFSVQGSA
jgi:hypothetical protein